MNIINRSTGIAQWHVINDEGCKARLLQQLPLPFAKVLNFQQPLRRIIVASSSISDVIVMIGFYGLVKVMTSLYKS